MLLAPACALLLLSACRSKPEPSPDFVAASQRFNRLYAQRLDEAYLDPQMDEIEAQLQRVPDKSLDAPSAAALLARIREGRTQAQKRAQDTRSALAELKTPLAMAPSSSAGPSEPPVDATPDAGPPDAGTDGPQVGTPESELVGGFRGCFFRGQSVNVIGRGPRQTWELQSSSRCRLEYAALVDSLVVTEDGKVLMISPKSAVKPGPAADAGR
ncbi:hypothetical protein FGE12_00440 [Aggregicoccus sp. 17bor-14]|nr:hypothetical protein [Simulacricoccus sp. 17bor-14]MRI86631.1 hypothetical protein [Aggregicoccus sp. 17bor-14]